MFLLNKNILPSISNLENILNSTKKTTEIQSDLDCSGQENILYKTVILSSRSPLSSFSKHFVSDSLKDISCQAAVETVDSATSPKNTYEKDKAIQTFKTYHQRSRRTQTKNHKIKSYSRNTQTPCLTSEDIRENLVTAFPNSPLLTLPSDQFSRIITGNSKIPFSQSSIIQGLNLQSVSGTSGYNRLRSIVPKTFPSTRVIRRALSSFYILPGVITSIIELFSNKLLKYPLYNQKIILSFDEFSVSAKVEYSQQHKIFVGLPTLEPSYANAEVQHCLIIIAQCLTLPIRIPVSVDFTTSSTKPEALKDRIFQVIGLFECHQIHVEAITCDLGPNNKALLKLLGVKAVFNKNSNNILNIPNYNIVNSFVNPFRYNSTIKVFIDFTHIFKRLRGQLERTDFILDETARSRFMKEYNLSPADNHCSFHWIRLLYQREQEQLFNGAAINLTYLTNIDIWPSGYQKMRVKHTSKVFSYNVGSALNSYRQNYSEFAFSHSTGILLIEAANWFKIVNNYHADRALSSTNFSLLEKMKTIIINFAQMIVCGKFVKTLFPDDFPEEYKLPKSSIKPIQASLAISSASIINIFDDVKKWEVPKFYTSNTTQDACESLFSELRAEGFGNPTPLRILQLLKSRILTFKNLCNKNFSFFKPNDEQTLLNNNLSQESKPEKCDIPNWIRRRSVASFTEQLSLHYSLGSYGRQLKKLSLNNQNHEGESKLLSLIWTCKDCSRLWHSSKSTIKHIRKTLPNSMSIVTISRNFGNLLEPTDDLFKFAEWVLQQCLRYLSRSYIRLLPTPIIIQSIYNLYISNQENLIVLPSCHPVARFLIERITKKVISVYCSRLTSQLKKYKKNPSIPSAVRIWKS